MRGGVMNMRSAILVPEDTASSVAPFARHSARSLSLSARSDDEIVSFQASARRLLRSRSLARARSWRRAPDNRHEALAAQGGGVFVLLMGLNRPSRPVDRVAPSEHHAAAAF
jgi:hypothetical protein